MAQKILKTFKKSESNLKELIFIEMDDGALYYKLQTINGVFKGEVGSVFDRTYDLFTSNEKKLANDSKIKRVATFFGFINSQEERSIKIPLKFFQIIKRKIDSNTFLASDYKRVAENLMEIMSQLMPFIPETVENPSQEFLKYKREIYDLIYGGENESLYDDDDEDEIRERNATNLKNKIRKLQNKKEKEELLFIFKKILSNYGFDDLI